MSYELRLPAGLKKARGKVKIRNSERLEEPQVTIMWKLNTWRLSLRTGEFLEEGQAWKQIDEGVREAIEAEWETLKHEWDAVYPHNPISGENDDQDAWQEEE